MKIKISDFLIVLLGFLLAYSVETIRGVNPINSILRLLRLSSIPFLMFVIVVLIPQQPLNKIRRLFFLFLPPLGLMLINLLQLFALPAEVLPTHTTGSARFTAWFLLYFAVLLNLNAATVKKMKKKVFFFLITLFVVGISLYPLIIMQAGGSLGSALSNYGQLGDRYQLAGIFGSANEDANGLVTLLPLAMLWIERQKPTKRKALRWLLLVYFPLVLVFNGTRTALLISFPLIALLFYWRLSLYKLLCIIGPVFTLLLGTIAASESVVSRFFAEEMQGGGTFGWRIEHAWIPTIQYTLSQSPLFGFGTRGWEFICTKLSIINPADGLVVPAHSGYVWSFITWGASGFCLYIAFLLILLAESIKLARSKQPERSRTGRALLCSVIGYCFWAFISNVMWPQGWLILLCVAILIACEKVSILTEEQEDTETQGSDRKKEWVESYAIAP